MKIRRFPFIKQILFLTLVIFMVGCNQDDTPDYNFFTVDGKEYKIEECVIYKRFETDTSGRLTIGFYDKKIELFQNDSGLVSASNTLGLNCLEFQNYNFQHNLQDGKYTIDNNPFGGGYGYGYSDAAHSFESGIVALNAQSDNMDFEFLFLIVSAEISLGVAGNSFNTEFDCLGRFDEKIEGRFSGVPVEMNIYPRSRVIASRGFEAPAGAGL